MRDGEYVEEGRCSSKIHINEGKKTVFLIGDSIRIGYCEYAREALAESANVIYPNENCRNTQYTYVSLEGWKNLFENPECVDVVYWNNGHWDIAHWGGDERSLNTLEQYCDMLTRIVRRLKIIFPNAQIVFSTTLPKNPWVTTEQNPRTNAEIIKYNSAAKAVLEHQDVLIDDLYETFKNVAEEDYADYCHFTVEANKRIGKRVAAYIKELISKKKVSDILRSK